MGLPIELDHINLWLLEDDGGWTIIDSCIADEATRAAWETVFATTLGGRPVRKVLVTHYHPDHAGNAAWLCQRFAVPLWMTRGEYLTAHAARSGSAGYSTASQVALFRRRLDTNQIFFAMGEAIAHLHYLHYEGRLTRAVGADGVARFARTVGAQTITTR